VCVLPWAIARVSSQSHICHTGGAVGLWTPWCIGIRMAGGLSHRQEDGRKCPTAARKLT